MLRRHLHSRSLPSNVGRRLNRYHLFHSTPKREILPLIGIAVAALTIRYSYRALVRMDEEWEDYERELREYESSSTTTGGSSSSSSSSSRTYNNNKIKSPFRGYMGIDLGSTNLKMAFKSTTDGTIKIVENREGSRSTPVYLWGNDVGGKLAKDKLYERPKEVINPRQLLNNDDEHSIEVLNKVIRPVAKDALEKTLGTSLYDDNSSSSSSHLFGLSYGYPVRPVFTYPAALDNNSDSTTTQQQPQPPPLYRRTVTEHLSEPSVALFLPEPIAAQRGAMHHNLVQSTRRRPNIILDIGGDVTTLTLLQNDIIAYQRRIPNMGATMLQRAAVRLLSRDFFQREECDVDDSMAVQRMYDAAENAVLELGQGTKTRSDISIPYLTVDEKMHHHPRHLEYGLSRSVLSSALDAIVADEMMSDWEKREEEEEGAIFSKTMPPPVDAAGVLASVFMLALEESGVNPFELGNVLLVGGGGRSWVFREAAKKGVATVVGEQFVQERMVFPEGGLVEELVVIGAALSGDDEEIG